jgi:hypothetical protein
MACRLFTDSSRDRRGNLTRGRPILAIMYRMTMSVDLTTSIADPKAHHRPRRGWSDTPPTAETQRLRYQGPALAIR